jgi:glycosyltransferase involved in cell wall biosynthesis
MKQWICCVTNDLVHDRRMHRICHSLQRAGFAVTLIGRGYADSAPLIERSFHQIRMHHYFRRGKLFYIEYQIRLLFHLFFSPAYGFCAIDLDTILPVTIVGWLRKKKRVYDAHEWFTEVPELEGRNLEKRIWELIGFGCVPQMNAVYTVGPALAKRLSETYDRQVDVVRNVPYERNITDLKPAIDKKTLFYQGALNMGRGLEEVMQALTQLPDYTLVLAGEGDLSEMLRKMATDLGIANRVRFLGWIAPEDLPGWTIEASIGLNLLHPESKSYYYSLANKAFDYIQALLPAIHMDFPEYKALAEQGAIGVLIQNLEIETICSGIRKLEDRVNYSSCQQQLAELRQTSTWEREEVKLLNIYRGL